MILQEGIQSLQTDPDRKAYGCYYFCILKMIECLEQREFSQEDIVTIAQDALEQGLMTAQYFCLKPHVIANLAAGHNVFRDVIMLPIPPYDSYYVVYNTRPGYGHFTLQTPTGTWDPLDPNREAAKLYTPSSYRRFVPA